MHDVLSDNGRYMNIDEIEFKIEGRVQYVMFRDFVNRKASKYNLKGYVKNKGDGSVEVVAQGQKEALLRLEKKLWQGPILSKVLNVSKIVREPKIIYDKFEIKYE